MGILKFKLTDNIPVEYPLDENVGAQYITTFQREQPGDHYPLRDSTGNPIPQVRLSGDYLISEYGSTDADRQRGYQNLKTFLKQLPDHMKVAYLKPYQDPYGDEYYSRLGLEKVKVDDRIYYTTKRPILTFEIEGQLNTLGYGPRNPDLIVPYLTPSDGSDGLNAQIVNLGGEIARYANLIINRCDFAELEVEFINNLRKLLEAARRRAVRGGSSKKGKSKQKKSTKWGGDESLEFATARDEVARNIAKIGELTNNSILSQYAYDIRLVQNVKDLLNYVSKFQNEWSQYKKNNPELFKYIEYGQSHNKETQTCNEIEEERFGLGHSRIAKQVFRNKIDRLFVLTHGSATILNDSQIMERVGFLCQFDVDPQDAYDNLEDNSWSVLQAAYHLGIENGIRDQFDDDLPPISMLRAHREKRREEEHLQAQMSNVFENREMSQPSQKSSSVNPTQSKYTDIVITAKDGKRFTYDGSAKLENDVAIPMNRERFEDWKILIDKYNSFVDASGIGKQKAVFDLKQQISNYNDKYSSQLKQVDYVPSYIGMGESAIKPPSISSWIIAAVILAVIVISVIYNLLTRYETEFPSWIHGAGAVGSGLAVAGLVIAWGYQYQIKQLHNSYQK